MLKLMGRKTLLSPPSERKCQVCEETKPLTTEYFQAVKNFASGYSTYCMNATKNPEHKKKKNEEEKRFTLLHLLCFR